MGKVVADHKSTIPLYPSAVLTDGTDTSWPDYMNWHFELTDQTDTDRDGVPDFSDVTDDRDYMPPVIVVDLDEVILQYGSLTPDLMLGVTATDDVDGNITGQVATEGTVNTAQIGTHTVTYDVSDAWGNAAVQQARVYVVVKANQAIDFAVIPTCTYGDAEFVLTGTASSGMPVSFSSSVPSVVFVTGIVGSIVGAGSVTITASQAGNSNYKPAPDVSRSVTVAKKGIGVVADSFVRGFGTHNPDLTLSYVGLVPEDTGADVNSPPALSCAATSTSLPGVYRVVVAQEGNDDNYEITSWTDGVLTITNAPPVIQQASPVAVTMAEDGVPLAWAAPFISADDDGAGPLTWTVYAGPEHGSVTIGGVGEAPTVVAYSPYDNWHGTDIFTVRVADNYGGNDMITVNVTVQPVNDPPQLDLNTSREGMDTGVTFVKGADSAITLFPDSLSVVDVDNSFLSSATITISNLIDPAHEYLEVGNSSRSVSSIYDADNGVLVFSGNAPLVEYEQALKLLHYVNVSPTLDTTPRLIEFRLDDGDAESAVGICTVFVSDYAHQLELRSGWNLLAFSFDVAPWRTCSELFCDDLGGTLILGDAWGKDETETYRLIERCFMAQRAFWVLGVPGLGSAVTSSVRGRLRGGTVHLRQGWNMIGPVVDTALTEITGLTSVSRTIWAWYSEAKAYETLEQMGNVLRRGKGYWFYAFDRGEALHFPNP